MSSRWDNSRYKNRRHDQGRWGIQESIGGVSIPSWQLAYNPSFQIDWAGGHAKLLNGYRSTEASIKALYGTFSTPAKNVTGTDGNLYPIPANSIDCFHMPVGVCQGQLIEEARTNLLTYSQDLSNAAWTKTNATITADVIAAPDRTMTADLVMQTSTTTNVLSSTAVISAGSNTATSLYLKIGNNDWIFVQAIATAGRLQAYVNIATGTVGTVSTTGTASGASCAIDALSDGYYRIRLTGIVDTTSTGYTLQINAVSGDMGSAVNGATYYPWGAQLESGTFVTSYIPTTTATVTRAASSIIATDGSALATVMQSAKSVFAQTQGVAGGTGARIVNFNTGIAALAFPTSTSVQTYNGSGGPTATLGTGNYSGVVNASFGMDASGMTALANGGTKATLATAWAGNTGDVQIGNRAAADRSLNGYLKNIAAQTNVKGAFDSLAVAP